MTTEPVYPKNLSKELQERVDKWTNTINKISNSPNYPNALKSFELISFDNFFCHDESFENYEKLEGEIKGRENELRAYGLALKMPHYEKQLRKELKKASRIKDLPYHIPLTITEEYRTEKTEVLRVPHGLVYKFWHYDGGLNKLVSVKYIECDESDLHNIAYSLMDAVVELFGGVIPDKRLAKIYSEY